MPMEHMLLKAVANSVDIKTRVAAQQQSLNN